MSEQLKEREAHPGRIPDKRTSLLALGALGVVYGDIGTNPLFAMREAFQGYDLRVTSANILGLLSLIFWALILVVTVKYVSFVMRADNGGEGGILALVALLPAKGKRGRWLLVAIGLLGAAFLFGDGMVTPAISVLAAVEGTVVATPGLERFVVPAAALILFLLFLVQRRGTGSIGRMFGPVMLVWFTVIGILGGIQIVENPGVFRALLPTYAVSFFARNGALGFLVLGAVILVVVGAEALFADLGHFGRRPIALGWHTVVLPSLLLVYFGQGALLLRDHSAIDNPFYRLSPAWALYPLVVLATVATVIASQALISGAFSLTRQAVQLGYSPRVDVKHTSAVQIGQIYVPAVNWTLMIACLALVLGFRKSGNLAGAYGLAVSTTMVLTTILFYVVVRERFGWPRILAMPLCGMFMVVDLAFFGATLFKIPQGGWVPIVVGLAVFSLFSTWRTGQHLVRERRFERSLPLPEFLESLGKNPPVRAPGAGAYMYGTPGVTPPTLLASLRHHDSLHEQVMVISVLTERRPRVHPAQRVTIEDLGQGFHQVVLRFGFMEDPDVPRALTARAVMELGTDFQTLTYFVGREALEVTARPGMARWREHLFAAMSRNSRSAAHYFRLPAEQTFELGTVVEL